MASSDSPKGKILLRGTLWALTALTFLNLLLSASIAGLIGGILILVMVWGIKKGDYPLVKGLSVFLLFYAGLNLIVLLAAVVSATGASVSALIWLGVYSVGLIALSLLLRSKPVRSYLQTANPPQAKEKKFHFFHGGWRDL